MKEFTLPIEPPAAGETVTFKVEWGDGTSEVISYNAGNYAANGRFTHEYIDVNGNDLTANEFEIKIYPLVGETFGKYWRYNTNDPYAADSTKLKEIKKWGCFEFAPNGYAFNGCSNLNISATDTTYQQPVIPAGGLNSAFRNCSSLNPVSISADAGSYFNDLNTGLVTSLAHTFYGCTNFNTAIGDWDVSGVSQMSSTFHNASSFNQGSIGDWEMGEVEQASFMFAGATAFNKNLNGWNMEKVVNATSMFQGATAFNGQINLWNMDSATTMSAMFKNANSFDQPIGSWNTADVTSMFQMFSDANSFNQDLSGWSTSNVTTMQSMFENAVAFNQGIGAWDTSSVDSMNYIFKNATDFNQDLSNWSITNVSAATDMFLGSGQSGANAEATNTSWQTQDSSSPAAQESESAVPTDPMIINIDLGLVSGIAENNPANNEYGFIIQADETITIDWGDGIIENYAGTSSHTTRVHTYSSGGIKQVKIDGPLKSFGNSGGNSFTYNPKITSISSWGDLPLEDLDHALYYAYNVTEVPNNLPSTVTSTKAMFQDAYLFNQDISGWDTSNVTDISYMFNSATSFNQAIGDWDTSAVTDMKRMFQGATSFNQPLNGWGTSNVTNMEHMFSGATAFNQPLNGWDTSNVTSMEQMFQNATNFNQDIGSWNTSSVTNMASMFFGASVFNAPINNWQTGEVTTMLMMFRGTVFNQTLSGWDVGKCTSLSHMFYDNTVFNQDISGWNTQNVTRIDYMFTGGQSSAFNQNIGSWRLDSLTNATEFLRYNSSLSTANYDSILAGWADAHTADETIPTNININFGNTNYSTTGGTHRDTLINTYGWTITDGGLFEPQLTLIRAGEILRKGWANTGNTAIPSANIEMIGWETEAEICAGVTGGSISVFTADGNVEAGDLLYVTNTFPGVNLGEAFTQAESDWKEVRSAFPANTATTTVNGVSGGWVLRFDDHVNPYKPISLANEYDNSALQPPIVDPYTVISVGDCATAATSHIRTLTILDPQVEDVGGVWTPRGEIRVTINGVIQQPWGDNRHDLADGDNLMTHYSIAPGTLVEVEAIPAAGRTMATMYASGGTFSDGQAAITQTSTSLSMPEATTIFIVGAAYY
jgi:surface protein